MKQEMQRTCEELYRLSGLEKISSIAFQEVTLLVENPIRGEKLSTSQKLKVS